jgi:hypothetical protein
MNSRGGAFRPLNGYVQHGMSTDLAHEAWIAPSK